MTTTPGPERAAPTHDLRALLALTALAATASAAAAVFDRAWPLVAASAVLAAASLLRATSDPPPATTGRLAGRVAGGAVNVGLLLVTLGGSIAIGEGVARWIFRDVTTTADFRGYFTNRWLRNAVRHNHYDFRGAEFEEDKHPGVFRVAVLGDSFTYGNGVAEADRFSNRIGAALGSRGVEVLNFGFPGNNWPEHVKALERRVLRLRPDYVLLQWGINDVELDRDVALRPAIPALIGDPRLHETLHRDSALYTLLNAQWVRMQLTRQMGDTYPDYIRRLYGDAASEGARDAERLLRRFVALCRERGIGVGLVMFPDAAVSLGEDYPYRFLHERTQAACTALTVPCLDLWPDFARVPDRMSLWASPLDAHPSALANRIAADRILETFAPLWRPEAADGPRAH